MRVCKCVHVREGGRERVKKDSEELWTCCTSLLRLSEPIPTRKASSQMQKHYSKSQGNPNLLFHMLTCTHMHLLLAADIKWKACFILWVIVSHHACNCSSQILCKVQLWRQQNSNSYIVLGQERLAAISMLLYLPCYSQLSSHDKARKTGIEAMNSLWTPRTLQNVAVRSSKIFRRFEPNWNTNLQVVYCCLSDWCRCVYFGRDIWLASAVKSTQQIYEPTKRITRLYISQLCDMW